MPHARLISSEIRIWLLVGSSSGFGLEGAGSAVAKGGPVSPCGPVGGGLGSDPHAARVVDASNQNTVFDVVI
jgi:hypothetical protein